LRKFEDILVECIEDIEAGRSSIESCLDKYPSLRERLEPLLRIALEIREPPDVKPSPGFKLRARVWLMEQIHESGAVAKRPSFPQNKRMKLMPEIRRFSLARIVVAIALALVALGGGTAYVAQGSLPGDALYHVKLGTEQMGIMISGDSLARAERGLDFADRRIVEIEALVREGRLEHLDLAAGKYEDALSTTLARIEETIGKGLVAGNVTGNVTGRVAEATVRHMEALANVHGEVPLEARHAIEVAMEASLAGYTAAAQALEGMGVDVSQLPGIPEWLRHRLEDILGDITFPTPGPPGDVPGRP
jgi:hypothetical protein